MNPIKEMMRQAHENQSQPLAQAPVATQGVKQPPATSRPETPPTQPQVASTKPKVKKDKSLTTELQQIARPDVPLDHYGVKGVQLHFQPYNKVLRRWLKDFSSENQSNGGCAITKTQVMEMMLDIMMYDLEIEPIGYESQQEMREDILEKIRNYR